MYANISSSNAKSILLFEKNGYINVGLKKDWIFYNNKFNDELLFQKILSK
jgi:diamine N-acetyltransferase